MTVGDGIFGAALILALAALYLFADLDDEAILFLVIVSFGVFLMLAGDSS